MKRKWRIDTPGAKFHEKGVLGRVISFISEHFRRTGSIEPSLTGTGFSQAGTCHLKLLNAETFMVKCTRGLKIENICFSIIIKSKFEP